MKHLLLALAIGLNVFNIRKVWSAIMSDNRGTNRATRAVRDTVSFNTYKFRLFLATIEFFGFLLCAFKYNSYVMLLPFFPTMGICAYMMYNNTMDKKRHEDARGVTKTAGKITEQVAEDATGAAAYAATYTTTLGNKEAARAAADAGKEIGGAVGGIIGACVSEMDDVKAPDVSNVRLDSDKLIDAAERIGIATDKLSPEQIASRIVELAPAATLKQLPDNLSDMEKASMIVDMG